MTQPTRTQINSHIGNATRELAPSASWKYEMPGDGFHCLTWLDETQPRPSEAATMAKATELAVAEIESSLRVSE